jgi:hypothetical protein
LLIGQSATHYLTALCHQLTDNSLSIGLPFGLKGSTNVLRVVSAAGADFAFDDTRALKKYVAEQM